MKKGIALFDFDGTLSTKDSFVAFFISLEGKAVFLFNCFLLSTNLIGYFLKIISAHQLKEAFLRRFLKGKSHDWVIRKGEWFAKEIIPPFLDEKRISMLNKHLEQGDEVIVVSASLDIWLKPWCSTKGITCICTQVEFENDFATGKLSTPNCNGEEKAIRVQKEIDLKNYSEIWVYGNSKGDLPLSRLATSQAHVFGIA